jgi:hypothetical protein
MSAQSDPATGSWSRGDIQADGEPRIYDASLLSRLHHLSRALLSIE